MMDMINALKAVGQRLGLLDGTQTMGDRLLLRPVDEQIRTGRAIFTEKAINNWLRQVFYRNPRIRYLSVELEENNQIEIKIISRYYIQMHIEARITDAWHDHKTSTLLLEWTAVRFMKMPILPNFISDRITYILLSLIGFLLNPIAMREGIFLRLTGESMRLDFADYWPYRREFAPVFRNEAGTVKPSDFFVVAAETDKGLLTLHLHLLSPEGIEKAGTDFEPVSPNQLPQKLERLQWVDALFLSGIALGVSTMVIFFRDYLNANALTFRFSWYFLLSMAIVLVSLMLLNVPRWMYQFFTGKTISKLEHAGDNITYRLERYKRDIELEMRDIVRQYGSIGQDYDPDARVALEKLLFKASRQRFLAWRMELRLESMNRWRKIKYGLAYVVTILSEYIAYRWL